MTVKVQITVAKKKTLKATKEKRPPPQKKYPEVTKKLTVIYFQ